MTLQDRIWASRIQNLPSIEEDHMLGKTVVVGEKIGTVTKEAGDDATGEVYEVELEDGTTITAGSHEMTISDPKAGEGEVMSDELGESTGDGSGSAESKEEEDEDTLDEYITKDGTRRKCKDGDGRRTDVNKTVAVEEEEEEVEEGKDEEYEKFFKKALEKFGVDSPADLEGEKKKEFFDYVDKNWKGEKKESFEFSAEELAHFESVLKKKEVIKNIVSDELDERKSAIDHMISGKMKPSGTIGGKKTADILRKDEAKERRARVDETPFEKIYSALQKNTDWIGYLDEMYAWKWFGDSSILEDVRQDIEKTGVYDKEKANKAYKQILDEQNKIRKERLNKIKEEEKNLTKNIGEIKKLMR
jgi:hypothetical protein